MKKILCLFFVLFTALIIQTTVIDIARIYNIKPALLLLTVIFLGFIYGEKVGIIAGLVGGGFADIAVGSYIGLSIISYMAAGYLAGAGGNNFYKDNVFVVAVICVASTILSQSLYFLLLQLLIVNIDLFEGIKIIVAVALYNCVLAFTTYKWFYRFCMRFED